MNNNGKAIELFLKSRDEKRKAAAQRAGKNPDECQYKSLPASRKLRK